MSPSVEERSGSLIVWTTFPRSTSTTLMPVCQTGVLRYAQAT